MDNRYKWPHNWLAGVIILLAGVLTLLMGVITPVIIARGPTWAHLVSTRISSDFALG